MKKGNIILTFIAVISVVGGTLAYKVRDKGNVWCKLNQGLPNEVCILAPFTTQFVFGTQTTTNPCAEQTVFYIGSGCEAINSIIETLNTVYETDL